MPADCPSSAAVESFDETLLAQGIGAEIYGRLRDQLSRNDPRELERLSDRGQRLMRDLGVTFALYNEDDAADWILPYDLFPRVLDPETWRFLSRGVLQRVGVWNEFFRDIYDSQEALKNGVVPFELVYDDPGYQRNAVGLAVPDDTFVHVAAFDLARDARGRWVVIEDYVGNVTGVTYGLQARAVLTQAVPELLETAPVCPVQSYPTELLEHLRGFARGIQEPRIVLLSPGSYNSAHYEHSWLARQMGIPLVRGGDLIVLNSRCYLKTIGGIEPIDVIYRRLDDAFIDPVAFRSDSTLGVPGLMTCVRKGTVTIANAIGTGLGDNRAIGALLPRLAKFYNRGPLSLPGVERRLCFDPDQRAMIESEPDSWVIQHVSERSNRLVWHPGRMEPEERGRLLRDLRRHPERYVAEPILPLTQLPTASAGLEGRHAGLRLFVFGGKNPRVFPLALTRHATEVDSRTISSGLGGGIRDTWILRGDESAAPPAPSRPVFLTAPHQRRLRLGSRIADSLYWMGRYKARAEQATRMLLVLRRLQIETAGRESADRWAPIWAALARATGHPIERWAPEAEGLDDPSYRLLLAPDNSGSVARCIASLHENSRGVRETIPPEVWSAVHRLHQLCEQAQEAGDPADPARLSDLMQALLDAVDQLDGAAGKNMLHDDAWHFWRLGQNVERALSTTRITREVLVKHGRAASEYAADLDLDALLRILSCQYAYRSLYQARPTAPNVVALILQDPALPRSVLACLEDIRASLATVSGSSRHAASASPQRSVAKLANAVEFADLAALFSPAPVPVPKAVAAGGAAGVASGVAGERAGAAPAPGAPALLPLGPWLDELGDRLSELSVEISDHHLHHQAFNILR